MITITKHRDEIKHNKDMKGAEFKGHDTIQDALLFMIEKAPFNQCARTAVSTLGSSIRFSETADTREPARNAAVPLSRQSTVRP